MYNRYQGNTGKVVRVEEKRDNSRPVRENTQFQAPSPVPVPAGGQLRPQTGRQGMPDPFSSITSLLQNSLGGLETDDIILLLILYLMYRESGDSELLIIMGAMFLL